MTSRCKVETFNFEFINIKHWPAVTTSQIVEVVHHWLTSASLIGKTFIEIARGTQLITRMN